MYMPLVGMIGQNGGEMTHEFLRISGGQANCYHITENQRQSQTPDVLVVSEASPVLKEVIPKLPAEGYLVVNADDKSIFPYLQPTNAKLITYGFNNKACITASSITDESLHICIQRSFQTLNGTQKDPQEYQTQKNDVVTPESTLAAASAWAICGS